MDVLIAVASGVLLMCAGATVGYMLGRQAEAEKARAESDRVTEEDL